jgi:hypothetical protein
VKGRRTVTAPATVDQLPLYLRAGTVLPLLAPDVDTLSDYGRGVVHLKDRRGRMRLLAFPAGRRSARAFERDRFLSRMRAGRWTLRIRASRARRYDLEASTAALSASKRRVCGLALGGRPLKASKWAFDRVTRVLRARFRAGRRATLVATLCH